MISLKEKSFRSVVLYGVFMSILLIVFAFVGVNQYNKYLSNENQIKDIKARIAQAKLQGEELKAQSEYKESDEYLERLARERLGMVKPNEIIYYEQNKK